MYKKETGKNKGMKIGLYLQTQTACSPEAFQRAMDIASNADFDILLFPEDCYCPEIEDASFFDFNQPPGIHMNPNNRWIALANRIPWDVFEAKYAELFPSGTGNVAKPLRMALRSLIIQTKFQYFMHRRKKRILCALLRLWEFFSGCSSVGIALVA